jgi:hypothetical protein
VAIYVLLTLSFDANRKRGRRSAIPRNPGQVRASADRHCAPIIACHLRRSSISTQKKAERADKTERLVARADTHKGNKMPQSDIQALLPLLAIDANFATA